MPKRIIHPGNGSAIAQPYGTGDETLWSVGRQSLNELLLAYLHYHCLRVSIRHGHSLLNADKSGRCKFKDSKGEEYEETFDLVIGADGAFSAMRDAVLKQVQYV